MENTTKNNYIFPVLIGALTFSILLNIFTVSSGGYMGGRSYEKKIHLEGAGKDVPMTPQMIEHCKTMPNMPGCEGIEGGKGCSMMKDDGTCGMMGGKMDGIMMDMSDPMSMSMSDMGKMLEGKTGDDLDKAFLEGMIPHHQGAVEMAKYLVNAKHLELRRMGEDIISAQQKEIDQMNAWLKQWGYSTSSSAIKKEDTMGDMMQK